MQFEWDKAKAEENERKHGVSFDIAILVFDDFDCLRYEDAFVDGEQRWHAIGAVPGVMLLLVVHTYRDEDGEEIARIISARETTRKERKLYAKNLG